MSSTNLHTSSYLYSKKEELPVISTYRDLGKWSSVRFFFDKIYVGNKQIPRIDVSPPFLITTGKPSGYNKRELAPLVDVFRNKKIEFDLGLGSLKILFESFNLKHAV